MRTILKRDLSILLLLDTKPSSMQAQSPYSRYEIGVSTGTFLYQGDLTPAAQGSARPMNTGFTVMGSRLLTSSLSARVSLAFGRLSGDDGQYKTPDWRQQQNFKFQTPILEFSAQAVWDPTAQNFTQSRIRFSSTKGRPLSFTISWSCVPLWKKALLEMPEDSPVNTFLQKKQ